MKKQHKEDVKEMSSFIDDYESAYVYQEIWETYQKNMKMKIKV